MESAFTVVGELAVAESATVLCVRNVGPQSDQSLPRSRFGEVHGQPRITLDSIFKDLEEIEFTGGWEVLMGQSECVNWVRSKGPESLKTMRYAGEYKFAGGNLDEGETFFSAGRRELEEEFLSPAGLALPEDAVIRPFIVKQTMPVHSKSNLMWNMVALAEENPWLQQLDVAAANAELEERRRRFGEMLETGDFWRLSEAEREKVAPEVRQLRWLPLREAVFCTLSTMVAGGRAHHVNQWQLAEFARLGVKRRDPMFMTACVLMELVAFPSARSLIDHCSEQMGDEAMQKQREVTQWLFTGMTNAEIKARKEPEGMVKDAPTLLRLCAERAAAAASPGGGGSASSSSSKL